MMTVYSSFSLASTALHCLYANDLVNFHLFFFISLLSVLNHSTLDKRFIGKSTLIIVDKVIVGAMTAACLIRAVRARYPFVPVTLWSVNMAWGCYVYFFAKLSHLPDGAWKPWHATLHCSTSALNHITLLYLQNG